MAINPIQHFADFDWYQHENAQKLVEFLKKQPQSKDDYKWLCPITEKLFSVKKGLDSEYETEIVKLFWAVHHLTPTVVKGISSNNTPANQLADQHSRAEALIRNGQNYPVPLRLIRKEMMPCKEYFASVKIEVRDAILTIPKGLLTHFSERMRSSVDDSPNSIIEVFQLDSHQFDTMIAFLETGAELLFNSNNAMPLFRAATHLQIPQLQDRVGSYLLSHHPSSETLLELMKANVGVGLTRKIEETISKNVALDLEKGDTALLEALKQANLPIRLSFPRTTLTDKQLAPLGNFPIEELDLSQAKELTPAVFNFLGSVKRLRLRHNRWVDDAALTALPKQLHTLDIEGCKNFTVNGLKTLSFLTSLSISSCHQLKEEDFTAIRGSLETLDVANCKAVGQKAISHFATLPTLKTLRLTNTAATGFASLAGSQLEKLSLNSLTLSDKELSSLPQTLVILELDQCKGVTEKGLIMLADRKMLKTLSIWGCQGASEEVIQHFSSKVMINWQGTRQESFSHPITKGFQAL